MEKKISWIVAVLVVLGALSWLFFGTDLVRNNSSVPTPTNTQSVAPSVSPGQSPSSSPDDGTPVGISKLVPQCQLTGKVVFMGDKLFRSENAWLAYQKVEDSHDIIRWSISPQEDVSVGPNRFSTLTLPQGRETITIAFNQGKPKLASYKLSASIDYPYVVNNKVEVLNKKCIGTIEVKIDY